MRYVIAGLAIVILVGGLATVKFAQISSLIAAGKKWEKAGPPPESVATAFAEEQRWGGTVSAVGTITSAKGVTISNEVPGIVSAIQFESGMAVKRGQVLVVLDSKVERAQLASTEARQELASVNAERTRVLAERAVISKAQLDTDESTLKSTRADVGTLRAQIDRKIMRAPFDGRLGIRQVNVGQYLNPGTTVTELEAMDVVFVDFSLPQQRVEAISAGMPVRVTTESVSGYTANGTIDAVSSIIDATTRSLKVRATVNNKEEKLRPGMFANVSVVLPETGSIVAVPSSAVVRASYGDSVFIVEDKKDPSGKPVAGADGKPAKVARQQFVRLGEARGDFVAVLDGVKAKDEVVSAGAFKLRNGAGVAINNDVKVAPELAPRPQNR
ncbi:MAG TPA: efflux RND transporter periplasmic adaptor subunit [Polyangiaceae bacterium]|nr:efflux RND transporter periplasmic adaptor subunit [Polyangiaceae bacterium]